VRPSRYFVGWAIATAILTAAGAMVGTVLVTVSGVDPVYAGAVGPAAMVSACTLAINWYRGEIGSDVV